MWHVIYLLCDCTKGTQAQLLKANRGLALTGGLTSNDCSNAPFYPWLVCNVHCWPVVCLLYDFSGVCRWCPRPQVAWQAVAAHHGLLTFTHGVLCKHWYHHHHSPQTFTIHLWFWFRSRWVDPSMSSQFYFFNPQCFLSVSSNYVLVIMHK